MFIVIEGSDGSGKTTQLKLVEQKLQAAGHDVETFDFPQYDQPSSYFVKRYLKGEYGGTDQVGPYTSSLFYALDRFEAAPRIREALRAGKVVLSNRFTGSSMAHQGTKLSNAEQRRGFFIWLDNLEFEMLRIPRPDISFILRVPAATSQQLMAEREELDIHETDLAHLEKTVSVYDDMVQLFPKDFQRIDCVRSGQLLDIDTINLMLWEKINPLLPAPALPTTAVNLRPQPVAIAQPSATESKPAPIRELTLQNASGLLAQKIERLTSRVTLESGDIPAIYAPTRLVPDAQREYEAKTSALLGLYAKLVAGMAKHGISAAEARSTANAVLPVGASITIKIAADNPDLEQIILGLLDDSLSEAQEAGADLFAQVIKAGVPLFKGSSQPAKRAAPNAVAALAEEFLSENHIGEQPPVQLVASWPRNENDLVADMLYGHTSLPLRTLQERVSQWPISRKLAIFEAYLGDPQPGPVLQKVHYSWDLLTPYEVFRQLQKHDAEALEVQSLTPRYGYDIPALVEETGLSDTFEKCFDLSLELYSILQQAGHHAEAQYATLRGHNQRFKMTQNATHIINMATQPSANLARQKVVDQMLARLTEAHPAIGEYLAARAVDG
jgi:dTMP kinase